MGNVNIEGSHLHSHALMRAANLLHERQGMLQPEAIRAAAAVVAATC